ncbi:MAG: DoxX family protein [Saprospiraceae bacterium]|nr:DoxX family protein [Pyrinomonadaceae bacterium]
MNFGDNKTSALVFLRMVLSVLMFIHGAARIANGTVDDFGGFLGSSGFPFGFYLAWTITLFELVASVLFAAGFYAWIIALIFAIHLGIGIALVHYREGWFVVGAGRNGMEFSVLLIAAFLTIALAHYKRGK